MRVARFRFGFLRPLAVLFFNNLEEVKIYQIVRQHNLVGCDCIKSKSM